MADNNAPDVQDVIDRINDEGGYVMQQPYMKDAVECAARGVMDLYRENATPPDVAETARTFRVEPARRAPVAWVLYPPSGDRYDAQLAWLESSADYWRRQGWRVVPLYAD